MRQGLITSIRLLALEVLNQQDKSSGGTLRMWISTTSCVHKYTFISPYLSSEWKIGSDISKDLSLLGFSGLSVMTDGGGRNTGLGKKENSELLRILLFSNNWNLYDKYMYIHRHRH